VRLLLDESIPRRLAQHLTPHDVDSVHDRSWDGLKNGALLNSAEVEYDVLITADQNLPNQQYLPRFKIRVVLLAGVTNRLEDLIPLVSAVLRRIESLHEGELAIVSWRD
jgi:predicted nuclease of predicted toxin-antitoxin system